MSTDKKLPLLKRPSREPSCLDSLLAYAMDKEKGYIQFEHNRPIRRLSTSYLLVLATIQPMLMKIDKDKVYELYMYLVNAAGFNSAIYQKATINIILDTLK